MRDLNRRQKVKIVNEFCSKKQKEFAMAFKYYGSLGSLQSFLDKEGILGTWEAKPNGVYMLRFYDGSNLHWSETKKTLWFSGKEGCKQALAAKIENALQAKFGKYAKPKTPNEDYPPSTSA